MDNHELKAVVEALLFAAGDPVSLDSLVAVIDEVKRPQLREVLTELQNEYRQSERGIDLYEVAGGFQLGTRADLAPWIKKMERSRASARLSRPGLETLAIIAYKQPVTRAEIEAIRGVDAAGVLKTLLERKVVRIAGRKEVPGRPMVYGTTKDFLEYLGLPNLSALPTLKEFSEVADAASMIADRESDPIRQGELPLPFETDDTATEPLPPNAVLEPTVR